MLRFMVMAAVIGTAMLLVSGANAQKAGVTSAVNQDANRTPPGAARRQIVIGEEIVYDELIETGSVGQAQVLMLDRTALTVGPNATLVIDKFIYDPASKTGDMGLTLRRGLLRFVGGSISKKSQVLVKTPVAVLGIRGGVVLINVLDDNTVDVTFLFGKDVTIFVEGKEVERMSKAGLKTRVTRDSVDTPWRVEAADVASNMVVLQGRAGAAGGLQEVPSEVVIVNATESALPSDDVSTITQIVDELLGNDVLRVFVNTHVQDDAVTSGGEQAGLPLNEELPPTAEPPLPPVVTQQFSLAGFARQTDQPNGSYSSVGEFRGVTETIQLPGSGINQNTASIGYDPLLGLYYGSQAGNQAYTAVVWDQSGNPVQALSPMNIDARAWNFNANTGGIEVVTVSSGYFSANRDADGTLLGSYDTIMSQLGGSPSSQVMPAYNSATNEFYAYGLGSTVSVLDAATGNVSRTITLDLDSAGNPNMTDYFIGLDSQQNVLVTVGGSYAYIFDLNGNFVRSEQLILIADADFDAGYANGQLFVFNSGIGGFQGYDLFPSYTDGNGFFLVSNETGSLSGNAHNFFTDSGEGPLTIQNPFDQNDPNLYDHPSQFSTKLQGLGVSSAIADRLAGRQIASDGFFSLTYFSISNPTNPVLIDLESQLTVTAGTPFDLFGDADANDLTLAAYAMETDPHRFSRHVFSLVGRFDVAGVSVTDIDFGLDASAYQTPLYIDFTRNKVFLANKVSQGDFANYSNYVFQVGVVAGDINSGGDNVSAGGGEIVTGNVRTEEFGTSQAFAATHFQSFDEGAYAVLAGDAFEYVPSLGTDPLDYVHVGEAVTPSLTLQNGLNAAPFEENDLLVAAFYQKGDGTTFQAFADDEGAAISAQSQISGSNLLVTPGSLDFDRVGGNVGAFIVLDDGAVQTNLNFDTPAFSSAYLSDSHFGLGTQGFVSGASGFLVSGKATSPDDNCLCAYLHWGYWAYEESTFPNPANAVGTFVAGIQTPTIDMPVSGTATFNGVAEAAWRSASGNPTTHATGSFNHTVNFADGSGTGTMTLNNDSFVSVSEQLGIGDSRLSFTFDDGIDKSGVGAGIFTGPQANNMGVVFNLNGGGGFVAAGSVRAERGPISP